MEFKKELKGKYWPQLKRDYYSSKFPLYLREGKINQYNNLFSYLENLHDELCELDFYYKDILKANVNNQNSNEQLSSRIIPSNKKQTDLIMKYEEILKNYEQAKVNNPNEAFPLKYSKFYYQFLLEQLNNSNLSSKFVWRNILNNFNLKFKVKLKQANGQLTLLVDNQEDELIKYIFTNLFENEAIANVNVNEKVFDESLLDPKRQILPYFNQSRIKYNHAYFHNQAANSTNGDIISLLQDSIYED